MANCYKKIAEVNLSLIYIALTFINMMHIFLHLIGRLNASTLNMSHIFTNNKKGLTFHWNNVVQQVCLAHSE